jgi:hypothetical protein
MALYIHSPIRLHGVVLILKHGDTFTFTFISLCRLVYACMYVIYLCMYVNLHIHPPINFLYFSSSTHFSFSLLLFRLFLPLRVGGWSPSSHVVRLVPCATDTRHGLNNWVDEMQVLLRTPASNSNNNMCLYR